MEIAKINAEWDLLTLYQTLHTHGAWYSPRGERTLELQNFTYTVAPYVRFNAFTGRNLNLPYIKREMAWYINADPTDLSIAEHAAQWGKIVLNGKLNSNYGSYWFGPHGALWIASILEKDNFSRRAVIPMYGTDLDHLAADATDVPCTIAIEFRIRDDRLYCRVIMRSQDILWGMGNDLPTFSFLHEIVAALLCVERGDLTVSVGSFHVYESRVKMFNAIIANNEFSSHDLDYPPLITHEEAVALCNRTIDPKFGFSKWLLSL
jgi:thymidylate synthase